MEIGKAIFNILSNDSDVLALVESRIFPNVAPQTTEFPFIIYDVIYDVTNDVMVLL